MVALSMAQKYGSELSGLVLTEAAAGGPGKLWRHSHLLLPNEMLLFCPLASMTGWQGAHFSLYYRLPAAGLLQTWCSLTMPPSQH